MYAATNANRVSGLVRQSVRDVSNKLEMAERIVKTLMCLVHHLDDVVLVRQPLKWRVHNLLTVVDIKP